MQDHPDNAEFGNEDAWIAEGRMQRGQPVAFATSVDPNVPVVESRFLVDWVDQHRSSTSPADPTYPNGVAIDVALDAPKACRVQLSYPAERCGLYVITCRVCALQCQGSLSGLAHARILVPMGVVLSAGGFPCCDRLRRNRPGKVAHRVRIDPDLVLGMPVAPQRQEPQQVEQIDRGEHVAVG